MRTTTTVQSTAAQRIVAAHRNLIWARYRDRVETTLRIFCAKRGLPDGWQDDLRQHATMALLRAADRIDANRGAKWPYLQSIIIGAMQQWLRDHALMKAGTRRNSRTVLPLPKETADPKGGPEIAVDLEPILAELPEQQALIVRLIYIENHTHRKVAEMVGISQNTVTRQKQQALAQLKLMMASSRTTLLS